MLCACERGRLASRDAPAAQAPAGACGSPAATPQTSDASAPALGDRKQPEMSTGVAAIVNDFVISDYDLDQRVALFVADLGRAPDQGNAAANSRPGPALARRRSARTSGSPEAQDHASAKLEVDKRRQEYRRRQPARRRGNPRDHTACRRHSRTSSASRSPRRSTWQKLVAARYGTDILINDQQVDEAMDRLKKGADKPQFLVSEIFIAVDRPEDETDGPRERRSDRQQIKQGAPFPTVAGQFSQSPSAADGGDIGWVVQGQLAEELDHALTKLRPGQTSPADPRGRRLLHHAICAIGANRSAPRSKR